MTNESLNYQEQLYESIFLECQEYLKCCIVIDTFSLLLLIKYGVNQHMPQWKIHTVFTNMHHWCGKVPFTCILIGGLCPIGTMSYISGCLCISVQAYVCHHETLRSLETDEFENCSI